MSTKCKRNILCIGKKDCRKKRARNEGICNCESWFSGDPILEASCKSAANAGNFASSREDFIRTVYGEQTFIDTFGYDPFPGNAIGLDSSGKLQGIMEQEERIDQTKIILEIAVIVMIVGIAIILIRR
ncbi:MAG: hypothetical protein AAFR66_17895 [Bacteroidota bacterium]